MGHRTRLRDDRETVPNAVTRIATEKGETKYSKIENRNCECCGSVPMDIEAVSVRQFRFKRHTQPMVQFLAPLARYLTGRELWIFRDGKVQFKPASIRALRRGGVVAVAKHTV
jgi:hypothetical protein